jgi:hypothetical protein
MQTTPPNYFGALAKSGVFCRRAEMPGFTAGKDARRYVAF